MRGSCYGAPLVLVSREPQGTGCHMNKEDLCGSAESMRVDIGRTDCNVGGCGERRMPVWKWPGRVELERVT